MKNLTVIIAAVIALIVMTLAIMLRPVNKTGEWETETSAETKTATTAEILTETEKTSAESTDSTTKINLPSETKKHTTATAEVSTTKKQSKLVSRLHEAVEKDREWLSKHEKTTTQYSMTPAEFRKAGVIYYNGYKFTYYSEKVLPGKGLNIPGRHSDGDFVRDGDGYICVASSDLPKGTVVDTPFGKGKVYDTGCPSGTIDIYVS